MPKKNQSDSTGNIDDVESQNYPGSRILKALTEDEIAQLLDALFAVLSDEQRLTALAQLQPDTQEIVNQIIVSPRQISKQAETTNLQPTSLAKLAQTWSQLWQEWNEVISEASQEEGKYIAQEADWEEPYFDNYTFVEDLEQVSKKMKPLVQTAFENGFHPNEGFASSLLEAESEISDSLPDWMEIHDGIYVESAITTCLLHWEWLLVQEEGQDSFKFAQKIREWEEKFAYVSLNDDAIIDFFLQLSDAHKQCILAGLTANKESSMWKELLENTHSHWHQFYMEAIHQFAPDRYLENLRATIPQQWQNGLPIIEDLLTKKEYHESLTVIQETLDALLKTKQVKDSWTPETSLLFAVVGGFYYSNEYWENEKNLLRYYQQAVQELGQAERVNALEIQSIAFERSYDWSSMFKAFAEIPVSENTRQALFESWRDALVLRTKPRSTFGLYATVKTVKSWWLHWLLDSIATNVKGCDRFQQEIVQWLTSLSGNKAQLGEEYDILRLLTKDLTEISYQVQLPYPKFYQVVVRPKELSAPDDISRRSYLQQYAPNDLWERVMAYWKTHLQNFVPKPEMSHNSDYTQNAEWMAALLELAPQEYKNLLSQWKVQHQRRRNLWKAMGNLGLES